MTFRESHFHSHVPARTLATLLASIMVLVFLPATAAQASGTFTDDNDSVHEFDIEWIAAQGITRGCNPPDNDNYCPDDPVTRGQMATFLVRALDVDPSNVDFFTDDNTSIHEQDIQALAAAGITHGCNPPNNDNYCPDDPVTRGQMATFLRRALAPSQGTDGLITANCIQVIGFSQTNQWFSAGDETFESSVGDGRWQALIQGGGSVDRWADPGFKGWSNPMASPCATGSKNPDVVLFTVTGGNRSVDAWIDAIEDVLATIAVKVPSANTVILQPVVGGPDEALCPVGREAVRASENHPNIDDAIAQVAAARSYVVAGASPEVDKCASYEDEIGHLTPEGSEFVAGQLGNFYSNLVD